jgi:DNA-binding MarR family transcriptional regulator
MNETIFGRVAVSAAQDSQLRARDFRILVTLSSFGAGRDIFPSLAAIAERAGIDRRAVQRSIAKLCRLGHLEKRPGGGRSHTNRYIIPGLTNSGHSDHRLKKERAVRTATVSSTERAVNTDHKRRSGRPP